MLTNRDAALPLDRDADGGADRPARRRHHLHGRRLGAGQPAVPGQHRRGSVRPAGRPAHCGRRRRGPHAVRSPRAAASSPTRRPESRAFGSPCSRRTEPSSRSGTRPTPPRWSASMTTSTRTVADCPLPCPDQRHRSQWRSAPSAPAEWDLRVGDRSLRYRLAVIRRPASARRSWHRRRTQPSGGDRRRHRRRRRRAATTERRRNRRHQRRGRDRRARVSRWPASGCSASSPGRRRATPTRSSPPPRQRRQPPTWPWSSSDSPRNRRPSRSTSPPCTCPAGRTTSSGGGCSGAPDRSRGERGDAGPHAVARTRRRDPLGRPARTGGRPRCRRRPARRHRAGRSAGHHLPDRRRARRPAWSVTPVDGKLAVSPRAPFIGYRGHHAGHAPEPAFWFGHGLGYAELAVRRASGPRVATSPTVDAHRHEHRRAGQPRGGAGLLRAVRRRPAGPPRRLADGSVGAGESVTVEVPVDRRLWRRWDTAGDRWGMLTGTGELLVARGLGDVRGSIKVDETG